MENKAVVKCALSVVRKQKVYRSRICPEMRESVGWRNLESIRPNSFPRFKISQLSQQLNRRTHDRGSVTRRASTVGDALQVGEAMNPTHFVRPKYNQLRQYDDAGVRVATSKNRSERNRSPQLTQQATTATCENKVEAYDL